MTVPVTARHHLHHRLRLLPCLTESPECAGGTSSLRIGQALVTAVECGHCLDTCCAVTAAGGHPYPLGRVVFDRQRVTPTQPHPSELKLCPEARTESKAVGWGTGAPGTGSRTSSQFRELTPPGPCPGPLPAPWEDLVHRFCLMRGWSWVGRRSSRLCWGPQQEHLPSAHACPQARDVPGLGLLPLGDLRLRCPCQLATSEWGHEALSREGQCSQCEEHTLPPGPQQAGAGCPGERAGAMCTGTEAPATPLGVHRPRPAHAVPTGRTDSLGGKTDDGASPGSQQRVHSRHCVAAKTNATAEATSQPLGCPVGSAWSVGLD